MGEPARAQPAAPNFDHYVGKYVQLRDKIKQLDDEHKEKMKPYRELLERLNGLLLEHLKVVGADSSKTPAGTVYKTLKKSATIADAGAFRAYVIENRAWEMCDWRVNVTAATAFIEENEGELPPGVNYTTHYEVGVRRAASNGEK